MESSRPSLIVGLGNPGEEYRQTRHNVGFMAIERLLQKLPRQQLQEQHLHQSWIATAPLANGPVTLQKPLTFMNLSGSAVAPLATRLQTTPDAILVVYDDLDLPLGRLRLRRRGSSGGHRGVESIINHLGSAAFGRLRIGIGRSSQDPTIDYVLAPFDDNEAELLDKTLDAAVDAILLAIRRGINAAMNQFNGFSLDEPTDNNQTGARDD